MDNPFGGFEPHPRLLDVVSPTNGVSLCNLSSASDAGVCRVLSWLGRVRGLFRFVVASLWWCGFCLVGRECPLLQLGDGPAQPLFVLVDRRVEDGVAVVVEGACVMRALAYVEAEPDVDVSGLHVDLPVCRFVPAAASLSGTVMTPDAGIHITRRPHPRPVAVFPRMGRVPISGRGVPCAAATLPDHERQGDLAIPHSATGPRGAGTH